MFSYQKDDILKLLFFNCVFFFPLILLFKPQPKLVEAEVPGFWCSLWAICSAMDLQPEWRPCQKWIMKCNFKEKKKCFSKRQKEALSDAVVTVALWDHCAYFTSFQDSKCQAKLIVQSTEVNNISKKQRSELMGTSARAECFQCWCFHVLSIQNTRKRKKTKWNVTYYCNKGWLATVVTSVAPECLVRGAGVGGTGKQFLYPFVLVFRVLGELTAWVISLMFLSSSSLAESRPGVAHL